MDIVTAYLAEKEPAWSTLYRRNVSRTLYRLSEALAGETPTAALIGAHLESLPVATPTRHDAWRRIKAWVEWAAERGDLSASILPPPPRPVRRTRSLDDRLDAYAAAATGPNAVTVAAYHTYSRQTGQTAKTLRMKLYVLRGWAAYADELDRTPTPDDVLEWVVTHDKGNDVSRATYYRQVRAFWNWAAARGMLPDAVWPRLRFRRRIPRVLSESEIDQLIGSIEDAGDRRALVLVACILDTGLRLGELASLRRRDILDDTLHVMGKVGGRVVPVSPHVRAMMWDLSNPRTDAVWQSRRRRLRGGRALGKTGVAFAVREAMSAAGFNPPQIGPHTLRHTFATGYIRNGGDVHSLSIVLGHSSIRTTALYLHLAARETAEAQRRYSPMRDRLRPVAIPDLWLPGKPVDVVGVVKG